MKQSTIRLSKVVEETLLYSQIELILQDPQASDRERKRTAVIVLDEIADTVVTAAEYRNRLDDITFLNNEQHHTVHISISETYLQVLIEQLIDNACMYSPHGSPILCEISKQNGDLIINIQDEGRGLSNEQIKEVDAFVQFEREYYEQQGIGIGLALVKKIIQLSKGSLQIESTVGVGTKVTVYLPTSSLDKESEK
jgi:two-component system, sensor histidine kinase and response regulator